MSYQLVERFGLMEADLEGYFDFRPEKRLDRGRLWVLLAYIVVSKQKNILLKHSDGPPLIQKQQNIARRAIAVVVRLTRRYKMMCYSTRLNIAYSILLSGGSTEIHKSSQPIGVTNE